jgi:hypothetical protein
MSRVAVSGLCAALLIACGGSKHPSSAPTPPPVDNHEAEASAPDAAVEDHEAEEPEPPPPDEPPAPPAAPTTVTVAAQQVTVKVTSKGKGKKVKLAYALHAGDARTTEITFLSTVDMPSMKMNMILPAVTMVMDSKVLDVDKSGLAHVTSTLSDVKLSDVPNQTMTPSSMQDQMKKMIGMTVETHVAPDGTHTEETVTVPAGASANNVESMQPTAIVMPPEKLGVGATWTVTQSVVQNNIHIDSTTTYKLVSRKGKTSKISFQIALVAPKQQVNQNGMAVDLESFTGNGTGDVAFDPSTIWLAGQTSTSMAMDMNVSSQKMHVAMTIGATAVVK